MRLVASDLHTQTAKLLITVGTGKAIVNCTLYVCVLSQVSTHGCLDFTGQNQGVGEGGGGLGKAIYRNLNKPSLLTSRGCRIQPSGLGMSVISDQKWGPVGTYTEVGAYSNNTVQSHLLLYLPCSSQAAGRWMG